MSAPTRPAGHEEFEALAVAWAIAALEPEEQARFESHCAGGCETCADEAAAALSVGLELAYAVPDVDPPASLRERVLGAAAAIDAERTRDDTWVGVQGRRGSPVRRLVGALAAAALVGVSAVTTWRVVGRDTDGGSVSASRTAALSALVGDRSIATVMISGGRASVVTDSLPTNADRGTRYVLWGVRSGGAGAPTALGSFVVTSADLHSYAVQLVESADGYPVLAVSEEKAGPLPVVPSRVIARGALSR